MSTLTMQRLVGRGLGWQKLGLGWDPVNSMPTLFQPWMFHTFANISSVFLSPTKILARAGVVWQEILVKG